MKALNWMMAVAVMLCVMVAMPAVAQETDTSVTVKITLTANQVKALKAYRELRPVGGAYVISTGYLTATGTPIPPSTPDYDVVPKVKPVLGFNAWVEERLAAHLNSMIEEVERQRGEELAAEVRALTPEQKKAIKAQVDALKEKK